MGSTYSFGFWCLKAQAGALLQKCAECAGITPQKAAVVNHKAAPAIQHEHIVVIPAAEYP